MEFTLQTFITTNLIYITTFALYRFYNNYKYQELENKYELLIKWDVGSKKEWELPNGVVTANGKRVR